MQVQNWDDLRIFLEVAEAGQIGRAARRLALDPTTIGRRLRRLETHLGTALFERSRDGQVLTEAGEALLERAETMARAALQISEGATTGTGVFGNLRISVSEGFGSQFLTAYLGAFFAKHPGLTVDLVANSGFLSPSKREADIAVMLSRPKAGPVLCRKLSDYRLRLYASRDYLEGSGVPKSPRDLAAGHTLVGYVPDLIYAPELNYLHEFHAGLSAKIRSSSINAQTRLLAEGAGIGVLPCFIGDGAGDLTVVCPDHSIMRTFWIVTHRDTQNLARVRAGKEWLLKCVQVGNEFLLPPDCSYPCPKPK